MDKPTVRFIGDAEFLQFDTDAGSVEFASVFGVDHPRLGRGWVRTSSIVKKNEDGSFETLNTLYVPTRWEE